MTSSFQLDLRVLMGGRNEWRRLWVQVESQTSCLLFILEDRIRLLRLREVQRHLS